jgi:hypothetical protein
VSEPCCDGERENNPRSDYRCSVTDACAPKGDPQLRNGMAKVFFWRSIAGRCWNICFREGRRCEWEAFVVLL